MSDVITNLEDVLNFMHDVQQFQKALDGIAATFQGAIARAGESWTDSSFVEAREKITGSMQKIELALQIFDEKVMPVLNAQIDWIERYQRAGR